VTSGEANRLRLPVGPLTGPHRKIYLINTRFRSSEPSLPHTYTIRLQTIELCVRARRIVAASHLRCDGPVCLLRLTGSLRQFIIFTITRGVPRWTPLRDGINNRVVDSLGVLMSFFFTPQAQPIAAACDQRSRHGVNGSALRGPTG